MARNSSRKSETRKQQRSETGERRVYTRGGVPVVCFGGGHFVPKQEKSRIDPDRPVDRIEFESRDDDEVIVAQRKGRRTVRESWSRVEPS